MNGLRVTARTIRNYLNKLGWKVIRTKYCQFVSEKNRIERYVYARMCLLTYERFNYHIFVDECTVELSQHGSFYRFRISPDQIKLIGKYSNPASINIIGGISRRGRTRLIVFSGNLNSQGFQDLSNQFVLPFIERTYPNYHSLYLDGAGHHRSAETTEYLRLNNVNKIKAPAQNPIELVWNDLKFYLKNKIKPNTIEELCLAINRFWETKVTL